MISKLALHSVENITVLYRGRRYWHTPQLNQAIEKVINHFGDRKDIPTDFIVQLMKGINQHGLPSGEGWNTFYEPCPVVKSTDLSIVVVSKDLYLEDLKFPPYFCEGGKFHVSKTKLQKDGKAHHSRHGEYFYLNAPESAIALPQGLKQLEVIN